MMEANHLDYSEDLSDPFSLMSGMAGEEVFKVTLMEEAKVDVEAVEAAEDGQDPYALRSSTAGEEIDNEMPMKEVEIEVEEEKVQADNFEGDANGRRSHVATHPFKTSLDMFSDFDPSQIRVEPVEPVDSLYKRFGGRCLALRNMLSERECNALIDSMTSEEQMQTVAYRQDYRRNDRVVFESHEFAALLWERLRPVAAQLSVWSDVKDRSHQRLVEEAANVETVALDAVGQDDQGGCPDALQVPIGCEGLWQPCGLNECFRLCRYNAGGFFRAHTDGMFMRSQEEISLFTCMFYLDAAIGGATRFLKPDMPLGYTQALEKDVLASLQPEAGLCLLFFQPGLLHEGADVESGTKHILRTEVMFRRQVGSRSAKSEEEEEALRLVRKAADLEEAGELKQACELYRRAFKLDPSLEHHF